MEPNSPSKGSFSVGGGGEMSSQSRRGHNKPRCIKCDKVARSRCPFQSCKNCCAEAQNPCHIHVLKQSATFPDKSPTPAPTLIQQQSTEASPVPRSSHRVASLRQLSTAFAQFNDLQTPLRSSEPLTEKEAADVNEWRFQKVKEYKEGMTEMQKEAFDRYMFNASLLEEVFAVDSIIPDEAVDDVNPIHDSDSTSTEQSNELLLSDIRLKQRSNPIRRENLRRKVQTVVENGLAKLRKFEQNAGEIGSSKQNERVRKDERVNFFSAEKEAAINDLMDRINKAQNEDDLKACLELKSQIFRKRGAESSMQTEDDEMPNTENNIQLQPEYSPPKWVTKRSIDQNTVLQVDAYFSTLENIAQL